jgi:hypothetical protein
MHSVVAEVLKSGDRIVVYPDVILDDKSQYQTHLSTTLTSKPTFARLHSYNNDSKFIDHKDTFLSQPSEQRIKSANEVLNRTGNLEREYN